MLKLPYATEVNERISNEEILSGIIKSPILRPLYAGQVDELWWRNRLTERNFGFKPAGDFHEINIIEEKLRHESFDKRILREIDCTSPGHMIHILTSGDKHQIMLSDKHMIGFHTRIDNYVRSEWISADELIPDLDESSVEGLYQSLRSRIAGTSKKSSEAETLEKCEGLFNYLKKTPMTYSYKPILVMAAFQSGGQISLLRAAEYFKNFYKNRQFRGLPIEKGRCDYSNPEATEADLIRNLKSNPVNALCTTGKDFFRFDAKTQIFSVIPEVYDGLTVNQIDAVIATCNDRIREYFAREK